MTGDRTGTDVTLAPDVEPRELADTPSEELLGFIDGVLRSDCGLDVRDRLERSVRDFLAGFEPEGRFFRSVYRDNRLVAVAAVDRLKRDVGTLKWLFVAPEERGRGLGSRLLDEAIAFGRDAGYGKLVLCTMTQMEAARHLYVKKGFVFRQNVTYWRRPMQVYENDLNGGPDR